MLVDHLYVIAAVIGGIGLFMFSRLKFIPKWIRAPFGLILVAVAAIAGGLGYELSAYGHPDTNLMIGRVGFTELKPQQYVAMVHLGDKTSYYELSGDQWQIDARVLSWRGMFTPSSSYRFNRISGRYVDIIDETSRPRSVYEIDQVKSYVDVWQIVRSNDTLAQWVSADQGSSVFMPMADKALYSISLGQHGLIARAGNLAARQAILNWQ
ncbi:MAG: hypothetical protein ACI90U_002635 [Pseudomonadales bacterium]|jgi:hypothetical protein